MVRWVIIFFVLVIAGKGCERYVARRGVAYREERKAAQRRLVQSWNPPPPGGVPNPAAQTEQVAQAGAPAPTRDEESIRSLVKENSSTTYLREMGSYIERWPEHRMNALRVWIQRDAVIDNWSPAYPQVAERGFDEWREAGFPVSFDRVLDSATAQIRISFVSSVRSIGDRTIGQTLRKTDRNGWIVGADIQVATHDGRGDPLSPETVGGVARHEIGHALGLGHSPNRSDVMYPVSTTPSISQMDRATLHLLYMLPPGSIR